MHVKDWSWSRTVVGGNAVYGEVVSCLASRPRRVESLCYVEGRKPARGGTAVTATKINDVGD